MYRCGIETRYAHAYSPDQAKVMMMRRLAIEHEVSYQMVFGMFNGDKPNFLIEEEKTCPKPKMVSPEPLG
jgi:hypothetical protein